MSGNGKSLSWSTGNSGKEAGTPVNPSANSSVVKIWVEGTTPFILVTSVINKPGIGAKICKLLALKGININSFMAFSAPGKERIDMFIEVSGEALPLASYLLGKIVKNIKATGLLHPDLYIEELVTLVIQGQGLSEHPGIAAKIFGLFAKHKINVWSFITTKIEKEDTIRILIEKRFLSEYPEIPEELKQAV